MWTTILSAISAATNIAKNIGVFDRGSSGYQGPTRRDWMKEQEIKGFEQVRSEYEGKVEKYYEDYEKDLNKKIQEENEKFEFLFSQIETGMEQLEKKSLEIREENVVDIPFKLSPVMVGIFLLILIIMVK